MPSPEEILTVVRELQPRLPALLGEKSAEVQDRISSLIEQLEAGQSDGTDLRRVLCEYPAVEEVLSTHFDKQIVELSFSDRSYQKLAGMPSSAFAGKKYICPVPDCSEPFWFQRRANQSPKICEEHGVMMVPAPDEG